MKDINKDISDFIFVEDIPQKADAIMITGGSYPEAAEMAADLWKSSYAPVIFIGGGVSIKTGRFPGPRSNREIYNKEYETEYDFYKDVLLLNGVPEEAIVGENKSGFTRENAVFTRKVVDEHNIKINKVLLICKSFHARRSLMFYQSAFPKVEFLVIPYNVSNITKKNWFLSEYGVKRVLGELKRCGDQFTMEDINNFIE
ncbi:YdcF family protein [Alloiococcus sp. CFN-8]|uniref:YdcF family protein n=1 Tax=Alloiococcus sp. CFN-8 TaxID=3416081 RepID=UPI003CF9F29E